MELNKDISHEEIEKVIRKLKRNKSPGVDKLSNEALQHVDVISILKHFLNMCLKFNIVPDMWQKAIISPIPKSTMKDISVPLNYRGISLLSCVAKVFTSIINNRITAYCNCLGLIADEQNGFRKGRSCQDHLFTLTNIIRMRKQQKKPTFAAFIDLQKAFDCVDRTLLLYKLMNYNIDGSCYRTIKTLYSNHLSCVKVNNSFTDWFNVRCGVRQGDNLSPTLFCLFVNDLVTQLNALNKGVKLGDNIVSILLYADDMVLISEKEEQLQGMLDEMFRWTRKWKLNVNISKSNIIHFRPKGSPLTNAQFHFGQHLLEKVPYYKYLGVYLDECLDFKKCCQILSDSATRALGSIISEFKYLKNMRYDTFSKLYNTGVVPILNYGSEVWGFGKFTVCDNVQNKAMRFFLGVHKYTPTAAVQGDMGWIALKYKRYICILRHWNRLVNMDSDRLTKKIFQHDINNSVRNSWSKDVENISELLGMKNIFENRGDFNIRECEKRFYAMSETEWQIAAQSKPKLRTYLLFKENFGVGEYVRINISRCKRYIFAQFRAGILPLMIEVGRFKNVRDETTGLFRKLNAEE